MILSEVKTIYKRLRRDGTEVMRVCLTYPSFIETIETPVTKKLNVFFEQIAQAYLRYAERLVAQAKHGSSILMDSKVSGDNRLISVYFDIREYEGTDRRPKLVNYRRFSYVWDRAGGYIISADKLIKNLPKQSPVKYDGCYIDGGKIYGFINHYRKGSETGKRRSDIRRLIENKYVGMLSDCIF